MSNEQWAKETAEILEYWLDDVCYYEYENRNDWWRFRLGKSENKKGFASSQNDYEKPIDSAIYLLDWFL